MQYRETPLSFECDGSSLIGVLASPDVAAPIGVLIVVGGPQYRVGSHRQFVLLARSLAAAGVPCLRFDYRGMGDSEGTARTFESADDDLTAAIDAFQHAAGVGKVALWGLCDGASAAVMYSPRDPRVAGVIAVNPWVHTEGAEASVRLRHYYVQRLASREFWRKMIGGGVDVGNGVAGLLGNVGKSMRQWRAATGANFLGRMHDSWLAFKHPVLFILSGSDLTAREFMAWMSADRRRRQLAGSANCEIFPIEDADHTFSSHQWRRRVELKTLQWIRNLIDPSFVG